MFEKNLSLKRYFLILVISFFLSPQSFSSVNNVYWSTVDEFAYLNKDSGNARRVEVNCIGTGGFAGCIGVGCVFDEGDKEENKGIAVAHVFTPPLPSANPEYYSTRLPVAFRALLAQVPINEPLSGKLTTIHILSGLDDPIPGNAEKIREAFVNSLKDFARNGAIDLDPVKNFLYPISGDEFGDLRGDQRINAMFNKNPGDGQRECDPDFTNTDILKTLHNPQLATKASLGDHPLIKTTHPQQTSCCGKLCVLL